MNIFLIRHGETNYNILGKIQGKQQIPLNETGKKQAEISRKLLKKMGITHIYSSKLIRAQETATIINSGFGLKINYDNRLNERNFGDWENKLWTEIFYENPEIRKIWKENPLDFSPPNGETVKNMISRVEEFFKELILNHNRNDRIIVVLHGGPLKVIVGFAKELKPEDYYSQKKYKNCEIVELKHKNEFCFELNILE